MDGINLALLPPLTVVEQINYEQIVIDVARAAGVENLAPSDPAFRVVLAGAYREALLRQDANEQARGVMLAYATGSQLDHIGATYYRHATGAPVLRLDGEHDEAYRARLQASTEGLSVAGPTGAYAFAAKSAHSSIADVAVHSPAPVEVDIYILTYDGDGTPSAELCEQIRAYIEPRRPLTDLVRINPASIISYEVKAALVLKSGPDGELVRQTALAALQAYIESKRKLGSRVVESALHAALTVEGVEEVHLDNWQDLICDFNAAPYCQNIELTIGGYL